MHPADPPLPPLDTATPARLGRELAEFGQQDGFFRLAAAKRVRSERLKAHFAGRAPRRLVLSQRLGALDPAPPGWQVEHLGDGALLAADAAARADLAARLADAVVVVNNNDVAGDAAACAALQAACTRTVFIGWDWDNHHWLERSATLAATSDLYAPSHLENLWLVTRYNQDTVGPVPCGTVQWSRRELAAALPMLATVPRSDLPLGMHIPYGAFVHRLRVIRALAEHFPSVGFSDRSFHGRTAQDRLAEWAGHKSHWIIPVLNDVPIRLFDALVTGGIPIVPASLRHLAPVCDIPDEHIVFYSPQDIVDPKPVVARANARFDAGGADGLVARHRLALDRHHGNARVEVMLDHARRQFGW